MTAPLPFFGGVVYFHPHDMGSVRGPRARTVSNRSRWKKETAFEAIQKSKEAGRKHTVKGGVARLSFGPDGPGDDDDTLWVWDEEELLPNGSAMTAARKATFDDRWPYTGRRGWRPTSNKLSEAGFHYTPTDDEEDGCACIYCGVELGGWEKTDDPMYVFVLLTAVMNTSGVDLTVPSFTALLQQPWMRTNKVNMRGIRRTSEVPLAKLGRGRKDRIKRKTVSMIYLWKFYPERSAPHVLLVPAVGLSRRRIP